MLQKEVITMFHSKTEKKKEIQVDIFHCAEKNADIVRIMLNSACYHMMRKLIGFQSENLK